MNDLSSALHDLADHTATGEAPVADLIAAGKKRRARNRAASAGMATLALAAVVGVSLSATGATAPSGSTNALGSTGAAARTPAMELAAAATSTAGSSFKFSIDSTLTLAEWQIDHVTVTCTGALDPVNDSAYIKGGHFEVRLVDGLQYISKDGEHWRDAGKGTLANSMLCGDEHVPSVVASDPSSVLKTLGKDSTVTKTSDGYKFTNAAYSGTVKVAGGKVSEIAYDVVQKKASDYPAYSMHATMKLSDYGVKVSVNKPL
ncbi:MAG: hypothetical protein QOC94_3887 [Actinoplanes sp.]|jgi:hypothetical protein|nr:hypothetical protein [Actinoplanes sp.]